MQNQFGTKAKSKKISFHESTHVQKTCPNGNVKFNKSKLLLEQYLQNMHIQGSLGCVGRYPKFKNGKYCCSDTPPTYLEKLGYINQILLNITQNVDLTNFHKIEHIIDILLYERMLTIHANEESMNKATIKREENNLRIFSNWLRNTKEKKQKLDRKLDRAPRERYELSPQSREHTNTNENYTSQQSIDLVEVIKRHPLYRQKHKLMQKLRENRERKSMASNDKK